MKKLTKGTSISFLSILGFTGFMGFTKSASGTNQYFYFIFFVFFSFFWIGKLINIPISKKEEYEISESRKKITSIILVFFVLLNFILIFMLSNNNLSRQFILLFGALSYSVLFNLGFLLVYLAIKKDKQKKFE